MQVGIVTEGNDDFEFYAEIVKKLLSSESVQIRGDIRAVVVGTNIYKRIESNTVYLFSQPLVDIAFYLTDSDDGECKKKIRAWYKKHQENGRTYPIVFGFPKPHLEQWLCIEQDALKTVFGLEATKTVTCTPDPKAYVHNLIKANNDETVIARDFYGSLGKAFNIEKMSSDDDFKKMRQNLRTVLGAIRNQ